MRGIDRRIRDLEAQFTPPEDEGAEVRRAVMHDILDEIASLKSCRAANSYRYGAPIQPTDPTGEHLGYPYTRGQLVGYAIRRVFEREREMEPDILTEETTEEIISSWTEGFQAVMPFGERWDEIEMEEPPGPATSTRL